MGRPRSGLQAILESFPEAEAIYFQPPPNLRMQYPCIVYKIDFDEKEFADNRPYTAAWRYQLTIIDRKPDSVLRDRVRDLPMSTFIRHFASDDLNHYIFQVYY